MASNRRPRLSLGRTVATSGALSALEGIGENAMTYVMRHMTGDWGDALSSSDHKLNEQALVNGGRVFSGYRLADGKTILWIITDAADDNGNRASTCVMLPDDY